jgi:hypothetical protein
MLELENVHAFNLYTEETIISEKKISSRGRR